MIAGTSTTSAAWRSRKNGLSAPWRRRCHADTAEHHDGAGDQRREQHVEVSPDEDRVGEHRADVVQHRAGSSSGRSVADRVLHPRVRGHDERRRERAAERDEPDRREVHPLRQSIPSEEPEAEERRLEEERGQALHRERRAEHVADVPRVAGPVHAELELLHEPGDDADRDVDHEQRAEELGQPLVLGVAPSVPHRLQHGDEEAEPDRHRHEQEVVDASSSRTGGGPGRRSCDTSHQGHGH